MSFRVAFGARCAFSGSFLVCGAPFLGSVLVRDVCADSGVDFGVLCAVFGLDFGARCVVRRFWGRFWCAVRRFLDSILVCGVWCADFKANFGAGVRRAVFWTRFWCAVCGAPILGPILVHGAPCVTSNQATPQTPC